MKTRKRFAVATKGCSSYLTPFKAYKIDRWSREGYFVFYNKYGYVIATSNTYGCVHLNGGVWMLTRFNYGTRINKILMYLRDKIGRK